MAKIYSFPVLRSNWKKDLIFWLGLYALMITTVFFFGLKYYPVANDNNIYGLYYRKSSDIFNNIILYYRNFSLNPLAFFTDAYLVMRFWNQLWVISLLLVTLHFFSCFFLNQIFERSNMKFSVFGTVIFAIAPPVFQSVYWLNISVRLVFGMFFCTLSVYLFIVFLDKLSRRDKFAGACLSGFWFFNLLSMGYCGQIAVFSFVFAFAFVIVHCNKMPIFSRIYAFTIPIINVIIFFAYLFFISKSIVADDSLIDSSYQTYKSYSVGELAYTLISGVTISDIINGINLIQIQSPSDLAITVLTACFCGYIFYKTLMKCFNEKNEAQNVARRVDRFIIKKIIIGIIITAIPFCVFLISPNSYISSVEPVFSLFVGIAVLMDTLFDCFDEIGIKIDKINIIFVFSALKSIIVSFMIALFFLCNISTIDIFKVTYETDTLIASNFLRAFEASSFANKYTEHQAAQVGEILLYNVKPQYAEIDQPNSCISDDRLFVGKINALSQKYYFSKITLILEDENYNAEWLVDAPMFEIDDDLNFFERK